MSWRQDLRANKLKQASKEEIEKATKAYYTVIEKINHIVVWRVISYFSLIHVIHL